MIYLLLIYLGTYLLPPPPTGLNSHFLVTVMDYRDWLQRKKRSNLKCSYVKMKEGGEVVGGVGREEEGKKEEKEKNCCVPSFALMPLHVFSYLIFP